MRKHKADSLAVNLQVAPGLSSHEFTDPCYFLNCCYKRSCMDDYNMKQNKQQMEILKTLQLS